KRTSRRCCPVLCWRISVCVVRAALSEEERTVTNQTGDVAIVEANPDDIDLIVPLFDQYRMFYGQHSNLGLARGFISARLEQRDSVIFLAIGGGHKEIGLGFALLYPSFNSFLATPIWILNDLYVLEGVRRKGLARQLIDQGRVLAEETG